MVAVVSGALLSAMVRGSPNPIDTMHELAIHEHITPMTRVHGGHLTGRIGRVSDLKIRKMAKRLVGVKTHQEAISLMVKGRPVALILFRPVLECFQATYSGAQLQLPRDTEASTLWVDWRSTFFPYGSPMTPYVNKV